MPFPYKSTGLRTTAKLPTSIKSYKWFTLDEGVKRNILWSESITINSNLADVFTDCRFNNFNKVLNCIILGKFKSIINNFYSFLMVIDCFNN